MRRNLAAYEQHQVFLNYPFDEEFEPLERAMEFAVVAGGMVPVCAKDLSVPDKSRLDMLVDAIQLCHYSVHDFSRYTGGGRDNMARFNCPIEMGMALFYGLSNHRRAHRCAFLVPTLNDYKRFASDLSGLDPLCHENDERLMLEKVYKWLRDVANPSFFNNIPPPEVVEKYEGFCSRVARLKGSGKNGRPAHEETREVMYEICADCGWWDWRATKAGRQEFSPIPLSWRDANDCGGEGPGAATNQRRRSKLSVRTRGKLRPE
jgi:hypothetical protein